MNCYRASLSIVKTEVYYDSQQIKASMTTEINQKPTVSYIVGQITEKSCK